MNYDVYVFWMSVFEGDIDACLTDLTILIPFRACLNRVFPNSGIFHFAGKAFSNSGNDDVSRISGLVTVSIL